MMEEDPDLRWSKPKLEPVCRASTSSRTRQPRVAAWNRAPAIEPGACVLANVEPVRSPGQPARQYRPAIGREEMRRLFEGHRDAERARDSDGGLRTFVEDCFLETHAPRAAKSVPALESRLAPLMTG